ncbi:hypothetical protein D6764_05260, partial [Candidatus Woesearchaeota archaeon]
MKKPNLFIVGAPKCGTTSLHEYLSQHPEIFMCPVKEPHYLCSDLHEQADRFHGKKDSFKGIPNDREYLQLFKDAGDRKIIGESTPVYLYSSAAPRLIKKMSPDAKIIIMLREPAEMLYSWHAQLLASGEEDVKSFEKALALEDARKKDERLVPATAWNPFRVQYSEHVRFSKYIRNYLRAFRRENILILFLEDMKKDMPRVYRTVLKFLGVRDTNFVADFSVRNPRTVPKSVFFAKHLKNPPVPVRKLIRALAPLPVRRKLSLFLTSILQKRDFSRINTEKKKRLQKKFLPEVRELDELLHSEGFLPKEKSVIKL